MSILTSVRNSWPGTSTSDFNLMKIIFFGSSEFSLSALQACLDSPHDLCRVITTPDQPRGRGLKSEPTEVRLLALEKDLPVIAPERLKDPDLIDSIQKLQPDVYVVSSYGKFIPASWLKIPRAGTLNVHPSLVPRYRGAAPINWPILEGERETGLSIIEVAKELDAGDIFYQQVHPIGPDTDAPTLSRELAELSYGALLRVLDQMSRNALQRRPQNHAGQTYARKLEKEDGHVTWETPAMIIDRKVRGLAPWPGVFLMHGPERLKLIRTGFRAVDCQEKPGTLLRCSREGVEIATSDGCLILHTVQAAGKKAVNAADFINGRRLKPGDRLMAS